MNRGRVTGLRVGQETSQEIRIHRKFEPWRIGINKQSDTPEVVPQEVVKFAREDYGI